MTEHDRDYDAQEREVAALYRGLDAEEPPPALDEAILGAAREEAGGRKSGLAGRAGLSIAASLMLATLTALMFAGIGERVKVQDKVITPSAPVPAAGSIRAESPAPEQGLADESRAQGLAPGPLVEPTREQRVPETARRSVVIFRGPEGRVVEESTVQVPVRTTASADAPPPARSSGVEGARQAPAGDAAAGGGQQARSLQELLQLVEQARLTESPEQRASRAADTRLAEIQALFEAGREQEAREMLQRFRETYPDVDVEGALRLPAATSE